ncbi:hypothetical protein K1719_035560 [Acacia pycnantha]|nr:hypothetical protein K1719_035560 [Acacia pycnantha]
MELSHELAKHDIKITFVNTDFTHKQIMEAKAARFEDKEKVGSDQIKMVSIPYGLEQEENRNPHEILLESTWQVMPEKLERLIHDINEESDSEKISCVIADGSMRYGYLKLQRRWESKELCYCGLLQLHYWPCFSASQSFFMMESLIVMVRSCASILFLHCFL